VSAARPSYGLPADPAVDEAPRGASNLLPLLLLVVGLAVAAIWFVARPAFDEPPAARPCEVVFVDSDTTNCVVEPAAGSRVVPQKSEPAS
jgi:hypothetical protein